LILKLEQALHRQSMSAEMPGPVALVSRHDDVANSAWASAPPSESGGGGLVSTIDDYFAFSRMMLNTLLHKGRPGREQILSRATVELMTSDQLRPEQRAGSEIFFGTHSSWV
jgi:CubicO group peptidase (beta-lactamase class C family)